MSLAKNIIVATALTGILAMAHLGAVQAGDATPVWRTMKPVCVSDVRFTPKSGHQSIPAERSHTSLG